MIINEYETTIILKPELLDDVVKRITERLGGIITDHAGEILAFEDWGTRKLAYTISKCARGHYLNWYFVATPNCILELERVIRIESDIIRFLTVRLGENVDVEELRGKVKDRKRRFTDDGPERTEDEDTFDNPSGNDDPVDSDND